VTPFFPDAIEDLARRTLAAARAKRCKLATAESCTGGLIGGALTEIPGSSDVFDRGFVVYSNTAKVQALGVSPDLLRAHGAVSAECARAMAEGCLVRSGADVCVAVTGIAGPGGGTPEKPAGLVHLCAWTKQGLALPLERRYGDRGRTAVRLATVEDALELLMRALA
jgi:nicotinamide-nucleotide amidase